MSECTSHLVEYAANLGVSQMTRISRIWGDLENRQVTGKSVSEVVYDHESEVGIIR